VTGLLVVETTFSNINGDPDAESLPRSVDRIGIVSDVSIKAKTNEGVDAIGRGEAIAAHAIALLRRV